MVNNKCLPERSLLDVGQLPIGEIAQITKREGFRPRATYGAHKWFARRFATTARSLLIAAVTPVGSNFWDAYYGEADLMGLTVLDPFMGGGVFVLESLRLGAKALGTDVEPVAAAIGAFQTELWELPDLSKAYSGIRSKVLPIIAPYYRTMGPDGEMRTILHSFWVQVINCHNCTHAYDAHPTFEIAKYDTITWRVCNKCDHVYSAKNCTDPCPECGNTEVPPKGTVDEGVAQCPSCNYKEHLINIGTRTNTPPSFRLFALESIPGDPLGPEKQYKVLDRKFHRATDQDVANYHAAEDKLLKLVQEKRNLLADMVIPSEDRSDDRLVRYGYQSYGQLYNARQKLHLALLAEAIEEGAGITGQALRIAFSSHLKTNNMLCSYAAGWGRLSPLFALRAYRHIVRPVEINPWLEKNGRGTWPNAVRSVKRAAQELKSSREPLVKNGYCQVPRPTFQSADVRLCDARNLSHISDNSVDLVVTDPPYYDYIAYSELAHFFTPWMQKLGLVEPLCEDGFPEGQLAVAVRSDEARSRFVQGLTDAFIEIRRVLKPGGRIVFSYQCLRMEGWQKLGAAMFQAGILPYNVFLMPGDSESGLHKHNGSSSWDVILVCCTTLPNDDAFLICKDDEIEAQSQTENYTAYYSTLDIQLSKGNKKNLLWALAVVHKIHKLNKIKYKDSTSRMTEKIL